MYFISALFREWSFVLLSNLFQPTNLTLNTRNNQKLLASLDPFLGAGTSFPDQELWGQPNTRTSRGSLVGIWVHCSASGQNFIWIIPENVILVNGFSEKNSASLPKIDSDTAQVASITYILNFPRIHFSFQSGLQLPAVAPPRNFLQSEASMLGLWETHSPIFWLPLRSSTRNRHNISQIMSCSWAFTY